MKIKLTCNVNLGEGKVLAAGETHDVSNKLGDELIKSGAGELPEVKETKAEREAREKAERREADRLAAEAEALRKANGG